MDQKLEHLRLLSLAHFILGGITYLIALFPIIHFGMGLLFLFMPLDEFESPPAAEATPSAEVSEAGGDAPAPKAEKPDRPTNPPGPPPELMFRGIGALFTLFGGLIILAGFALATAMIMAGRRMRERRGYTFCFAVAVIECAIFFPLHLALGALTIVFLLQPGNRELLGESPKEK